MPSTTCAFCGRLTHMTVKWGDSVVSGYQGVATCDHCGAASLMHAETLGGSSTQHVSERLARTRDGFISWLPTKGVAPEFPDVPDHIAAAASEAHANYSIKSVMSAILMARTVVEATAKEKGITSGNLVSKINDLAAANFIRESTKDAAHEIRHFGNDMAHGDISLVPDAEDAEEVLELMDEVLNEVFQGPARTARIKQKRESKKNEP